MAGISLYLLSIGCIALIIGQGQFQPSLLDHVLQRDSLLCKHAIASQSIFGLDNLFPYRPVYIQNSLYPGQIIGLQALFL